MMTYAEFFQRLTGFDPNPFQQKVAAALLGEKNVVLRAPTGSGKTWSVVAPLLYSLVINQRIADRLLYALPLRSLATSLYQSTKGKSDRFEETHHFVERIRIQTGEQRDDPLFEGLVTFTTIDQLLSSYLMQPVGLPSRLGNINAGALLGALICFDEFHLLEPAKSMATAIEMLDTVAVRHPLSRFVLMTATLADRTLNWLTEKLDAEFIDVPAADVANLPNEIGKQRFYRWVDEPLSARAVAQVHAGRRSIVIANTVTRAQELYEELNSPECRAHLGEQTQIRLLHSRFLAQDRKRIESSLDACFGPTPTVTDVILVATQVIEAGLDLSCDNLHTEVAPMNAIVQRAGRCARRKHETGTVWCYKLGLNRAGRPAYGAYTEVTAIVDATAAALSKSVKEQPCHFVFHDELELVNAVHAEWEKQQLAPLDNLAVQTGQTRAAMDASDPSAVRRLVRDVSSINVVITDQPESLNFNRRQWPEMLSIPPTSLYRLFDHEVSDGEWIAKAASDAEVFQGGEIQVTWSAVTSRAGIDTAGWLVAIHPTFAKYDADLGFVVGQSSKVQAIAYRDRPKVIRYRYQKEEYAEHIRRVCSAGFRRDPDNQIASRRLADVLGVEHGQLISWLELVYRLHDIGKLSVEWQNAVWKWQAAKAAITDAARPPLAHTDFDPEMDHGKSQPPRPPHASEGAYAAQFLLAKAFEGMSNSALVLAPFTAIARHHGAFTSSLTSFQLDKDAREHVAASLGCDPAMIQLSDTPRANQRGVFKEYMITATKQEHDQALWLYVYLVRRLRIADQNSFVES